ncbi:LOW QUALITY PROTEIN: glycosyltransferase family 92 protein F13G3.3-like [Bufo gargarizans]|uniref:LOW QUALITY PROTEIN: glycosyltransferase family 92 protein F13G3.3-like n=1 Tax=Bufo gargarizans TaxID=30331 RepID=UPI001CF3E9CF|nr:LOW QUALITY PROTEIN: glycosyltransferase family 92 protein F13G3.3-like [Bufo gargarizans]
MSSLQRIFLLVCLLVFLYVALYIRINLRKRVHYKVIFLADYNSSNVAKDTITPLKGNKTFIIAPYYDNREENLVRVLGIVHTEVTNLFCYFCCYGQKHLTLTEAMIDIHSDRFGFPFGLADINCYEPPECQATHMYLDSTSGGDVATLPRFEIRNRERQPFSADFTVCISTMHRNYSNALQFIQTIEMYKLLGAQRVTIYGKDCSQQVKKILDYYSKEGTVEVIPWPIEKYLRPSSNWYYEASDDKDIGYYGQLSTLNDCLYRNMYKSKYVLLNDLDEIILPFKHMTWDSMMEKLQRENPNVGVFLFESHNFPQTAVTDGNFPNVSSWKKVPDFNLLNHVHREPDRPILFNHRKMIVDPRKVIQTSVHCVLKSFGKSLKVPLQTALVHHCKGPHQPNLKRSLLINNRTIWKYNVSLIRNVNRVLSLISSHTETQKHISTQG